MDNIPGKENSWNKHSWNKHKESKSGMGEYLETGKIPEIGKNNGRPPRQIEDWEIQMVKQCFNFFKFFF